MENNYPKTMYCQGETYEVKSFEEEKGVINKIKTKNGELY